MAFGTTLINKLTQNLDQRLADRRARQLQEQQQQDALKQNQLLFEQQQRQNLQAQPQQMQMNETELKNTARIQQELLAQAQQIPIKTTPGLRELLASGDMTKIQAELPQYIQTEGDVKFFNTYKDLATKMIDPATQAYNKEKAIGKARSETLTGDIKAGIRAVPGTSRKSSGGSDSGKASNKQSSQLKNLYMMEKDAYGDLKSELKDMLEPKSGFDQDGPEIAEKRSEVESARRRVNQLRSDWQSSLGSGVQSSDDADALIEGLKKLVNPSAGNNNINIVPITEEEFNGKPAATKKNPAKPAAPSKKTRQETKKAAKSVADSAKKKFSLENRRKSLLEAAGDKRYNVMKNDIKKAGM